MNLQIRQICTKIDNFNIPLEDKSIFMDLAVAYTISCGLPLPTTLDGDYKGYFTTHHFDNVKQKLAEINEDLVFNVRYAIELVRAFYNVRLSAAYPAKMLFINDANGFFDTAFKADQQFTQPNLDILNKYKRAMMDVSNQLSIALGAK